jgi:hypothetical protein
VNAGRGNEVCWFRRENEELLCWWLEEVWKWPSVLCLGRCEPLHWFLGLAGCR